MNGRKSILCSARDSYRIRLSKKLYKEIAQIHQASFRMERWTSEVVVREVSAVRNIPERNPFWWKASDQLVNMYIRISHGDRRLE